VKWSNAAQRAAILSCLAILSILSLVFAMSAHPPMQLSNSTRAAGILGTRALSGLIWATMTMVLNVMVTNITPKGLQVHSETIRTLGITLGLGSGPLFSSILTNAFEMEEPRARAAAPGYFIAALWFVCLLIAWPVYPTDPELSRLLQAKEQADSQADKPSEPAALVSAQQKHVMLDKLSALCGVVFGIIRAYFTSSVESASALILEIEFGWATTDIGLVIGTSFLLATLLLLAIGGMRRFLDPDIFMHANMVICCLSTLLLFQGVGTAPPYIVLADILGFSTSFLAGTEAMGRAIAHAEPGTLLCVENIWVVRIVGQNNVSRFLSPPLARYVLAAGGRGMYAMTMFAVGVAGWMLCATLSLADAHTRRSGA